MEVFVAGQDCGQLANIAGDDGSLDLQFSNFFGSQDLELTDLRAELLPDIFTDVFDVGDALVCLLEDFVDLDFLHRLFDTANLADIVRDRVLVVVLDLLHI